MRKHTIGPWKIDTDWHLYKKDEYYSITAGEGYFDIESSEKKGFNLSGYMTDADAKLITASPLMYEMLAAFVNQTNPDVKRFQQDALNLLNSL